MKAWILIFSAAVFAGGTCLGVALHPRIAPQPAITPTPPAPESWGWRGPELSVHGFESQLDLSEEQQVELERIVTQTQRDIESYGRSIRRAHEESREAIKQLLLEDQKKKLDELVAQERSKRSDQEVLKAVEAYTKILSLTGDQARGLQEALVEAKAKRRAAYGSDKHRDRSFWRSIREAQNQRVEKALSPEQFKQYLEIQNLMDDRRGS